MVITRVMGVKTSTGGTRSVVLDQYRWDDPARGLGYDTSPMLGFDAARVRELLGLPEHVQFAGLVALGLRAEEGFAHHRHEVDRVATFY